MEQNTPAKPRSARLGAIAVPAFRNLWLGRTISYMGDYAFRIAYLTYVISKTHSAVALALSTAALVVPALVFYLLGGAVSDRAASRKAVMIMADIGRCIVTAAIAGLLTITGSVILLVVLALFIGVGDGFFQPASFAYLKQVTPKELLTSANSAMSVSQQAGLIAGPAFGGLLVGLTGTTAAFGFDAITFLASAFFLAFIKRSSLLLEETPAAARGLHGVLADIREGFRYVRTVAWLRTSLILGPIANAVFAGVLAVSVPLIMAPRGASEAGTLGGFYAVQAVGAFTTALFMKRLKFVRIGTALFCASAIMAVALLGVGLVGRSSYVYVMAFFYGVGLHFFNTLYPTLMHQRVPDGVLGRVSSVETLLFTGMMPIGQLIVGPLAAYTSARTATVVLAAAAALISLGAALLAPSIRSLRQQGADSESSLTTA
jgi:Transmembrane secretion effector